jgi:hypothetical protein
MVRVPGAWKTFDELEESLCLAELEALLDRAREIERDGFRFQASLKGIDLDGPQDSQEDRFEELKIRAQAQLAGMDESEFQLRGLGFEINYEE